MPRSCVNTFREITSVFEEDKHCVYTANCQGNVMLGMKFKSSATPPADGKGLMSLGAMNCRARVVNTMADLSVRGRQVDSQCGPATKGMKSHPRTSSGAEEDP